jgi:dCTP deaminase
VLQKEEITRLISRETPLAQRLIITPLLDPDEQIGPASVDLRLGTTFIVSRRIRSGVLDPRAEAERGTGSGAGYERIELKLGESLLLHPGQLILGASLEYLRLPADLGAYVTGRSSWGRLGLVVATAVMIQPGFAGCLTLELVNEGDNPLKLYVGTRVAQLTLHRLENATKHLYGKKYVGPIGPEVSKLVFDADEISQLEELNDRIARTTLGTKSDGAPNGS